MATTFFLSSLVLVIPALTLYSEKKYRLVQWIGAVVICYAFGMMLGNLPFIQVDTPVFNTLSEVSVSLAIPALLFSANLAGYWQHMKTALLSFGICTVAVSVSAVTAWYILGESTEEAWKISGMLIGVYTGGTPNMSAIGKALSVKEETFVLLNSIDMVLSGIYFIFLITIAKKVLSVFLPEYKDKDNSLIKSPASLFNALPLKTKFRNVLLSLGMALLIVGAAAGISLLTVGTLSAPLIILVLTTLGLFASFIPQVRNMEGSFQTAHYLLLVFALSIGILADFSKLLASSSEVFLYCVVVITFTISLHYLTAALFRLDVDTVIITSTAAIFGPAFIGPVANSIQNRQIIVAGIATSMLGYAIGNYLGLGIAWLLQ